MRTTTNQTVSENTRFFWIFGKEGLILQLHEEVTYQEYLNKNYYAKTTLELN